VTRCNQYLVIAGSEDLDSLSPNSITSRVIFLLYTILIIDIELQNQPAYDFIIVPY
jgi:hypothetical protein